MPVLKRMCQEDTCLNNSESFYNFYSLWRLDLKARMATFEALNVKNWQTSEWPAPSFIYSYML